MFDTRRVVHLGSILAAVTLTSVLGCTGDKGDVGPAGPPGQIGSSFTPPSDAAAALATKTPIKHLVIIFGENVSFDHYFATYPKAVTSVQNFSLVATDPTGCALQPVTPEGVPFNAAASTPAANNLLTPLDVNNHFAALTNTGLPMLCANPNSTNAANTASAADVSTKRGSTVTFSSKAANPFRLTFDQAVTADMGHNYKPEQLASAGGAMNAFPLFTGTPNPAVQSPAITDTSLVMGYYDGNTVTAMWNYAQHFAMNDNSWSTTFGPSTPGAINLISGQTNGIIMANHMPLGATHAVDDGQGGLTMIGDTDPLNDVCSTGSDQNLMSGPNIGDLLNAAGTPVTWGSFMGGFNLDVTNANGTSGCGRFTNPIGPQQAVGGASADYIPHHAWFQYYASTANPTHARPASVATIGYSKLADGKTAEPANHNYDSNDFFAAIAAGNLPAVSFIKAPAFQDGHAGYSDPLDEQAFDVSVVNALQQSPFWASTAVVILYDDSDGWYDHQAPPIVNPSSVAAINGNAAMTEVVDQLNGPGVCNDAGAQQGKTAPATAMIGATTTKPVIGRCGYGTRQPLLVISPFAKKNFIDHTLTDQTSVLKFIEDNWLAGKRISANSFDNIAGTIEGMFSFPAASAAIAAPRTLILDPQTGLTLDK